MLDIMHYVVPENIHNPLTEGIFGFDHPHPQPLPFVYKTIDERPVRGLNVGEEAQKKNCTALLQKRAASYVKILNKFVSKFVICRNTY